MKEIEIVVLLSVDEDADIGEVLGEMNYEFTHPAIKDTAIVDVLTEF